VSRERHEAIVIGGGVVGTVLAGLLAEAGLAVAILDQGDGAGTTSNAGSLHVQMQSRFMRLYPESVPGMESQLPWYPKAVRVWAALERRLGADFELRMTGGLMVAETDDQMAFLGAKALRERELGLEVEILDRGQLDRIAPYLGPAIVGAELCADEGKLNPLRANSVLRAWAAGLGVSRCSGRWVDAIESEGDAYRVRAGGVSHRAARVIVAAAWGSGSLLRPFGLDIPSLAEPLHINITEPAEYRIDRLIQHADRMITIKQLATGQVVIGGGWPARPGRGRTVPGVDLDSLVSSVTLAQHVVPGLAALQILRSWAGNNTAVDGRGVLGPVPGHPGLFVAIPGDAGYTLGPLSAEIVADAVLERQPRHGVQLFAPERFSSPPPLR
jgi:glycine/D-amino acid oxidase-like deaminating enzyme